VHVYSLTFISHRPIKHHCTVKTEDIQHKLIKTVSTRPQLA